jgi:LPS-assembly protein
VITSKKERMTMEKDENGEMRPVVKTEYQDAIRLRLEQGYDFREAGRNEDLGIYSKRPFGDLLAELDINIYENLYFTTKNYISPYEGYVVRHQSGFNLGIPDYGKFSLGYDMRRAIDEYKRYEPQNLNYIRFGVETSQFAQFSLAAAYYRDFKNTNNTETDVDLIFDHQCFQLIGRVRADPLERNYMLMIRLSGLGD